MTFQGVKIAADISASLLDGQPGEMIASVRYEDVERKRYESLFTVGLDEHHEWRILSVQVYSCQEDELDAQAAAVHRHRSAARLTVRLLLAGRSRREPAQVLSSTLTRLPYPCAASVASRIVDT